MGIRTAGQDAYEARCETCANTKVVTATMRAQVVLALLNGGWRVAQDQTWCAEHALDSVLLQRSASKK